MAERTAVRDAPNRSHSSFSVGKRSPTFTPSLRNRSVTRSTNGRRSPVPVTNHPAPCTDSINPSALRAASARSMVLRLTLYSLTSAD
jgi:hypothetical protein